MGRPQYCGRRHSSGARTRSHQRLRVRLVVQPEIAARRCSRLQRQARVIVDEQACIVADRVLGRGDPHFERVREAPLQARSRGAGFRARPRRRPATGRGRAGCPSSKRCSDSVAATLPSSNTERSRCRQRTLRAARRRARSARPRSFRARRDQHALRRSGSGLQFGRRSCSRLVANGATQPNRVPGVQQITAPAAPRSRLVGDARRRWSESALHGVRRQRSREVDEHSPLMPMRAARVDAAGCDGSSSRRRRCARTARSAAAAVDGGSLEDDLRLRLGQIAEQESRRIALAADVAWQRGVKSG